MVNLAVLVPDIVAAILGDNLPGHVTRSTWRLTRRQRERIQCGRDAQQPLTPIRLRDVHPTHRLGLIHAIEQSLTVPGHGSPEG
jgi:hypothetical protein